MEKVGAAMEGAVKRMASKPSAVATFTLVTALLPWIITFAPPLLRSLQVCGFATDAWRFLVGCLTTPVLFVLVNFVILSIWATSSAGAAAQHQQQQLRGGGEASEIVSQQDQTSTAAAAARAKRKETVLFLPPVSPVKSDFQRSVFSRSVVLPSPVITSTTEEEIEEPTIEEEPVIEETVAYTPESPKAAATTAASAAKPEEDTTEVFAHKSEAASKSKMELKISPPPPPSFLLEQQDRLKQAQARAAPKAKPKQVDRRNSAPVRSVNAEGSNVKTTQRSHSAVAPSSAGVVLKDLSFGDGNELSPGIIGTTDELRDRVESAIANFYAQLRLQKKNEELG